MDSSASNEADRELLDKLVKNVKRTVSHQQIDFLLEKD